MANKPWYELIEEVRTEHNGIFGVQLFFGHDGNNVCRFSDYHLEKASGESGRSMQEAVERCIRVWKPDADIRPITNHPLSNHHVSCSALPSSAIGSEGCICGTLRELVEAKMGFAKHIKDVSNFLSELYMIMVDPLAEGKVKVSEMCAALKTAALKSREFEYQHQGCDQGCKSRAVHDRAGHLLAYDPECEECRKFPRNRQDYLDISNLRFYAQMADEFNWQTDVIHKSVIIQTLNQIAARLAASRTAREPVVKTTTSPALQQPTWKGITDQIERHCNNIMAEPHHEMDWQIKMIAAQVALLAVLVRDLYTATNKT